MSTHARIGIANPDGSVTSIYTHYDGYFSHHGPILLNHYNTKAKIHALLALGDLSRLTGDLGEEHDLDTSYEKHRNWCCAYGRDGGENTPACDSLIEDGVLINEEYAYLFKGGEWHVWSARDDKSGWKNLALETITERLTT